MGFLNFFRGIYGKMSKSRYHIDEVKYDFDEYDRNPADTGKKLTTLKFDMSYITGKVYCRAGTIGYHKNGKKDGMHKMWNESHVDYPIIYMGLWKMGNREGSHKWYDRWNVELQHEINYKMDILDGLERCWYRGQLIKQIKWENGKLMEMKEWDETGKPINRDSRGISIL